MKQRRAGWAVGVAATLSIIMLNGGAESAVPDRQCGEASWYGGKWAGKLTASGEIYDVASLTAAHRTLPFGTLVRVTRQDADRDVVVRINNRGPFIKGRIIDLSEAAAERIGLRARGVGAVCLRVIGRR